MRARRWAACAVVAAVCATAACGGGSTRDPVADAGASLGRIHSGALHVKLEMSAGPSQIGFQMDGTFDLTPHQGSLPVADLTTVDLSMPNAAPVHFVSTGAAAFIVRDGIGYQLTDAQVAPIRSAPSSGATTLTGIDLRQWVVDPVAQPQTTAGGEAVDRVTGGVDPVAALNGIVELSGQFAGGGGDLRISDADAPRVRAAAKRSSFEATTATSDHLLRSLSAEVDFEAPSPSSESSSGQVAAALAKFGHLTLSIELRIERPNTTVTVSPPATVRPINELPSG